MPRSSSISSTKRKHLLFGIRRSVGYCECLADGSSAVAARRRGRAPRPQRSADVRSQDVVVTSPEVVKTTYLDLFGNVCRRFIAPSGDLQIWCTERSRIAVPMTQPFGRRRKIPVAELPDDCLVYLMGSRYCETG
jgi:hypothetical protein